MSDSNEKYFLRLQSMEIQDNNGKIIGYTIIPHIDPFVDGLEALQKQVGGYIEHFNIAEDLYQSHIDMWIDEEGKFKDYKPTFALCDNDHNVIDVIFGNCVFTRFDDQGETLGLDQEDIEYIGSWLKSLEIADLGSSSSSDREVRYYVFVVPGFEMPY